MKKNYILAAAILFGGTVFSQSFQNRISSTTFSAEAYPTNLKAKNTTKANRATNIDAWLDFGGLYDALYPDGTQNTNWGLTSGFALTNDSNELYKIDTNAMGAFEISNPGIYSVGKTYPLGGEIYQQTIFNPAITPYDPATALEIDTIQIFGDYVVLDSAVVDTLIVTFTAASNTSFSFPGYIYDVNGDMVNDTVYVSQPNFNITTKNYQTVSAEVKIPLLVGVNYDSTGGNGSFSDQVLYDATGVSFTAGDIFSASYRFKAGKTITSADTMGINANYFIPGFQGFNTSTTYPNYTFNNDVANLWGSHINITSGFYVDGDVNTVPWAYNRTGNSLGNFDELLIDLKVKQSNSLTASITELDNGAKLFQNYPNPTNGLTTVKYALENNATVSFEVIDITGKTVVSQLEGNKSEGTHTIELNTNALNAGVYFYSVVVNGNRLTKKMTITK